MPYLPITVTQDDIDHGIKKDCSSCPIARAINRVLAPKHVALVGNQNMLEIAYGARKIAQWLSPIVQHRVIDKWAASFDRGEAVQPFTFYLDLPERLISPAILPA